MKLFHKFSSSLLNRLIFFAFFRRAKASARQARSALPRRACLVLLARFTLVFAKNRENITSVIQAKGVREIGPILLVPKRPGNQGGTWPTFGHEFETLKACREPKTPT